MRVPAIRLRGERIEPRSQTAKNCEQISGTVISLSRSDDGMVTLDLDNGQVWRQQDAEVTLIDGNW